MPWSAQPSFQRRIIDVRVIMIFMLLMVVNIKWLLSLVSARYLKRSRDAESVKRFQQGGKRGKFWERFDEGGRLRVCYRAG
jgi:hypothetical protein